MSKKLQPVRWTVELAAQEFRMNPRTLSGRLRRGGHKPDGAGKFSTAQVCAAVFGDIDRERLREVRARADLLEAKARTLDEAWAPIWEFDEVLAALVAAGTAALRSVDIPEDKRQELARAFQTADVRNHWRHSVDPAAESEGRNHSGAEWGNPPQVGKVTPSAT